MKGIEQPATYHPEGDVFTHTMLALESLEEPAPFVAALAVLLHDAGKPVAFDREGDRIRFYRHEQIGSEMAEEIGARLKLSGKETDRLSWLVKNHMLLKEIEKMRAAKLKRLIHHEWFDDLLRVARADMAASAADPRPLEFLEEKMRELGGEERLPPPLLTGKDLIGIGMKPGPLFGKILANLYEEQLEGKITSREEALEFVRRTSSSPPILDSGGPCERRRD
jgi:hypothetical protein